MTRQIDGVAIASVIATLLMGWRQSDDYRGQRTSQSQK
jgi:hypothetical protein